MQRFSRFGLPEQDAAGWRPGEVSAVAPASDETIEQLEGLRLALRTRPHA